MKQDPLYNRAEKYKRTQSVMPIYIEHIEYIPQHMLSSAHSVGACKQHYTSTYSIRAYKGQANKSTRPQITISLSSLF